MKRGKVLAGVACFLFLFCITGLFAQEGFLRITSVPENVSVEVDGKAVGKTPLLTVLKPGKHAVKADLAGYSSETETIEILENEVTIMNITMEKQRTVGRVSPWTKGGTGNLTVISDWADVDIYVDGLKVNEKPPSTIKNISAGLHTVILVSGSYADSSRVFIQSGKTFVLKKNFEDDKKKASSGSKIGDLWSGRRRTSDIEAKRQALPARVVLKLAKPEAKETSLILGEGESMVVSFQYRKSGETDWTAKELQSGTKEDDTFTLEKGTYDILITYSLYKEPTGLLNIFLGAKKEKTREQKEALKQEMKADVEYEYVIYYDSNSGFAYKRGEKNLNTAIE